MARVIVEQTFSEPLTDEAYAAVAKRLDPCLLLQNATWRRSSLSEDRLRLICEFEAPDVAAVRAAHHDASVPFDSAWQAHVYAVEDYPESRARLDVVLERESQLTASGGASARAH